MNSAEKVNILMVDDQPQKLLSYEVILKELGENLLKASSGREALDLLLKHDIAVVLMDVSMPDIDGFELADMIRQHPRFQKTAIIFISGVHLSDVDRIKGYQRGAVDYISVPVVPELLRAKVSVFAELHRKTRQLERLNQHLEDVVAERSETLKSLNVELRQRVTELETLMQVLPVGVSVAHDVSCQSITRNAALTKMLGLESGENLSRAVTNGSQAAYEAYEKGQRLPVDQLPLQKAAATGQPTGTRELEVRHANGARKHLLASASPLVDDSGRVRGAVAAFFDGTQQKLLEDTLRERADLLELASEAIMVRDLKGRVTFWNSGSETLYGWKREEILGKSLHDVLKTKFPIPFDEIQQALTSTGTWSGDLIQCTKTGNEVVVSCRKAMNAERTAVLEINRDITARLKTEEALRKAEKLAAMGRMAGIVAHEINNPLEAITNCFYLLRDHSSLNEEARALARLGEEELQRVCHITRQTLSFYRESQKPISVCIPEILDNVLELQARPLQLNGITLEKQYRAKGVIEGFPVELKQVFLNLISNAIQAMPKGGRLRVRVFDSAVRNGKGSGTYVSIIDNGVGISSDQAKRLFEPFFTTKSTKGTGLGLWISKGIVQKYDGSLRCRSMSLADGKATCFSVFIPGTLSTAKVLSMNGYMDSDASALARRSVGSA